MVFSFGEVLEPPSRDFTFYRATCSAAAGTAAESNSLLPDNTPSPEYFLKPGDVVEIVSPDGGTPGTHLVARETP